MRVPPFERYGPLLHGFGFALMGMIIGAAIYHALFQTQFDHLVNLKSELEQKLDQHENDLKQLNQFRDKHTVIKSIQIKFEENASGRTAGSLDEPTKGRLRESLKADLNVFIGSSIYDIDREAKLARQLLTGKVYNDGSKRYVVEMKTVLVVDNVLQVWVKVSVSNID
ncbi:hypothetical protein [Paenibacillus beijingensis]|uniref:Sporulation membrane protein YtrI C-terminal domain-containing protein n=1 Tax=Paenibacillus beijingensis TaxID=1126833 RepID=A0A0D5NL43_9BACL|nr:hypothetical protein [Paenibacillus beijingensis]AJY75986.1 hypothetical protein VN24_17285 [Paenibacillus beijingensis]